MLAPVLAIDEKPLKNQCFCGSVAVFESPLGHHAAADIVSAAALFALLGGYPPCGATAFSPFAGSSSCFPYCILPGRMIH